MATLQENTKIQETGKNARFLSVTGKNGKHDGYYQVYEEHDGFFRAYRVGGSFVVSIPKQFCTEVNSVPVEFTEVLATIEGFDYNLPAFHNVNRRWNGWLVPYFEKNEVLKIMEDIKAYEEFSRVEFDKNDNLIIAKKDEPEEENEICEPYTIIINGQPKRVWAVGDGWCWEEGRIEVVEEEDEV